MALGGEALGEGPRSAVSGEKAIWAGRISGKRKQIKLRKKQSRKSLFNEVRVSMATCPGLRTTEAGDALLPWKPHPSPTGIGPFAFAAECGPLSTGGREGGKKGKRQGRGRRERQGKGGERGR